MSEGPRYPAGVARLEAARVVSLLHPYCERIEVAGSLRREKAEVGDIEIVCIPGTFAGGLFGDEEMRCPGFCNAVDSMQAVKGKAEGKYTQRITGSGIKLDLFMATPENWGVIFAIRTGSAEYSAKRLAARWAQLGYHSKGGILQKDGEAVAVCEERQLFELLGLAWVEPKNREVS